MATNRQTRIGYILVSNANERPIIVVSEIYDRKPGLVSKWSNITKYHNFHWFLISFGFEKLTWKIEFEQPCSLYGLGLRKVQTRTSWISRFAEQIVLTPTKIETAIFLSPSV